MKHYYQTIPGWFDFQAMYAWAVWSAPHGSLFVEVGSWLGRSAAFMGVEIHNSEQCHRLDCVDHWHGSVEHQNDPHVLSGTLYDTFLQNIQPVSHIVFPHRGESTVVAQQYVDQSVWFGFIDGSHDEASVTADLKAWWPKIAQGGVLAGHDFTFPGVGRAVLDFFADNRSIKWLWIDHGCWSVRCVH